MLKSSERLKKREKAMNEKEAQIERFGVNDANKKTFLSEFYGKKEENQRSQKKQQKSHFGLKKEQNDQ